MKQTFVINTSSTHSASAIKVIRTKATKSKSKGTVQIQIIQILWVYGC